MDTYTYGFKNMKPRCENIGYLYTKILKNKLFLYTQRWVYKMNTTSNIKCDIMGVDHIKRQW